ncbi:putative uncharacterized protein MSANTD5 [Acomys russatus]|uniref:putative uncharacterized protein MSANTD5 n=1 Tax=Acomys russatus TaxID=60746 RepID=UPI0021E25A94|nr:putative uncharacterized protein MSANTD5 [Acomys russatus]
MQEWEVVEQEVGHPGKKIHKKTKALCSFPVLLPAGPKEELGKAFQAFGITSLIQGYLITYYTAKNDPELLKIWKNWCLFYSPREANQHESLINTEESNVGWSGKQAGQRPSDPSSRTWTDSEIRVFLQEWEVVEQELGHPGKKIHKKTRALCQRLHQRGLKKSWGSCFHLLLSLQDLHRTLCNERSRMEPLFSPYAEALYRILGYGLQENLVQGPVYEGPGNPQLLMYPQAPRYQPGDYGAPVPSVKLQWNPVPMISQGYFLFPSWEPWNPGYPMSAPHLHPTFVLGDPSFQQLWSAAE